MDGVSCSDAFDRAFVTSAIEGWYLGAETRPGAFWAFAPGVL